MGITRVRTLGGSMLSAAFWQLGNSGQQRASAARESRDESGEDGENPPSHRARGCAPVRSAFPREGGVRMWRLQSGWRTPYWRALCQHHFPCNPREAHYVVPIVLSCSVGGCPNERKIGYSVPVGSTVRANFRSPVLTSVMVGPGVGADLANRRRRSARCQLNLRDSRTGRERTCATGRQSAGSREGASRRHT